MIAADVGLQLRGRPSWRNALGLLAGTSGRRVAGFVSLLIITRSLDPASFSAYALLLATAELARGFLGFGADPLLVQRAAARDRAVAWLTSTLLFKAVLALFSTGAVALIAWLSHYPARVQGVVPLLLPFFLFVGVNSSMAAFFQGSRQSLVNARLVAAASAGYFVALAFVSTWHPSVEAFLATLATYEGLIFVLQAVRAYAAMGVRPHLDGGITLQLLRTGWPVGVFSVLVLTYFRLDVVVLHLLRPADVAPYYASYKLAETGILVAAAVSGSLLAELGLAKGAGVELARVVRRAISAAVTLMFVLEALWLALGPLAIPLALGGRFSPIAPVVVTLATATVLMAGNLCLNTAIITTRRQALLVPLTVLNIVMNLALNVLLVPAFGYRGSAWATVATEAISFGIQTMVVWSILGAAPVARRDLLVAMAAVILGGIGALTAGSPATLIVRPAALLLAVGLVVLRIRQLPTPAPSGTTGS